MLLLVGDSWAYLLSAPRAPHSRQRLSRPQCAARIQVQGVHLRPEAAGDPADQARAAQALRRRVGGRPPQIRTSHGPELSLAPPRRRHHMPSSPLPATTSAVSSAGWSFCCTKSSSRSSSDFSSSRAEVRVLHGRLMPCCDTQASFSISDKVSPSADIRRRISSFRRSATDFQQKCVARRAAAAPMRARSSLSWASDWIAVIHPSLS
jgi:hypothetical protein